MSKRGLVGVGSWLRVVSWGGLMLGLACSSDPIAPPSLTSLQAHRDPTGAAPLGQLSDEEAEDTVDLANTATIAGRAAGIGAFLTALNEDLAARQIELPALSQITPERMGDPLPGTAAIAARYSRAKDSSADGIGQVAAALSEAEIEKYKKCPFAAPDADAAGKTCDDLVSEARERVERSLKEATPGAAEYVGKVYPDLSPQSHQFIASWGLASAENGALVASAYAAHELRAAGKCENNANRKLVAYRLGVDQGIELVYEQRTWAITQLEGCVIGPDAIAEQARVRAKRRVTAFTEEHELCPDADLSIVNAAWKELADERTRGIGVGIDQQVEVLRNELGRTLRERGLCLPPPPPVVVTPPPVVKPPPPPVVKPWWEVLYPPPPPEIRTYAPGEEPAPRKAYPECCSPIVVDLDEDGVELTPERVRFDLVGSGTPQSTTWVGPRDGLLVLDRNGDGQISTGAELFGEQTPCADGRCYDGVVALAAWDDRAQGGNGDQFIDARDAVFRQLAIWRDANHDGVSQPAELGSLGQHGILAINLAAAYPNIRQPAGTLTAKLEVVTTHGVRTAYDAWFKTRLSVTEMATVLLPPTRSATQPARATTSVPAETAQCTLPSFPLD